MSAVVEAEKVAENKLLLARELNAPVDAVFEAWTNPQVFVLWWGPRDFSVPACSLDVKPGGAILLEMQGPDGTRYPLKGEFHAIHPPLELSFRMQALPDADGVPGIEDFTVVRLSEQEGKTRLELSVELLNTTDEAGGALSAMQLGWAESLDRLETTLAQLLPGKAA